MNKHLKKFSSQYKLIVILFLLVAGFLIFNIYRHPDPRGISSVSIGDTEVNVELAITAAKQEVGLGGRTSLDPKSGMLFVFSKPARYYFWMKGMNFPIDIIWITEDMTISYIKADAKPEDYLATFGPDTNSKYVLEVVSGFAAKHKVKVGDKVEFTY